MAAVVRLNGKPGLWWGRVALSALVTTTCAFWVWFVAAVWSSEGQAATPYAVRFLAPLVALGLGVWKWPRATAVALIGAGAFALWYFPHPAPRGLMAAPMLAAGAGLLAVEQARLRGRRAATGRSSG